MVPRKALRGEKTHLRRRAVPPGQPGPRPGVLDEPREAVLFHDLGCEGFGQRHGVEPAGEQPLHALRERTVADREVPVRIDLVECQKRAALKVQRGTGEWQGKPLSLQKGKTPEGRVPAHQGGDPPHAGIDHHDGTAVQAVLPSLARAAEKKIGFPAEQKSEGLCVIEEEVHLQVDARDRVVPGHQQEGQGRGGLGHEDAHTGADKLV